MDISTLTHYTKDIEKIVSILEFGFFYSYHPTRTFDQLFKDADIDAVEPDDHAMICFTELDIGSATKHRSKFGQYGIAVSMEWAKAMGAKKVEYVERNSPRYYELLQKLQSNAPAKPFGYPANEQRMPMFEKVLRQQTLGSPSMAKFFGAGPDWKKILNELLWIQTEAHKEQNEWRIRNPNPCVGIQHREPTERDKKLGRINSNPPYDRSVMIVIMSKDETLRKMSFLSIEASEIKFIIVPKGSKKLLQQIINTTLYNSIDIIEV
ncbi:MAG: abortive infection system antitoxin AbiGi family protein [Candidatus Parcubacteria bacterium]|nr:abortive infection system antitoxin AbiGi family protein [Candidatus Parcubacteria bacterium]